MELTVHIPDDIAERIGNNGQDLSRRALEMFALEEYKNDRVSKEELRRLLGFAIRYQVDGFLKEHNVFDNYTMEDVERERETLRQLGY